MSQHIDTDAQTAHARRRPRSRLRILVMIVVVVAVLVWLGFWLAHRLTHVSSSDARVETNEVTVASRLNGRVTDFDVRRGDHLRAGDRVTQLYSRPDRQELAALQASVAGIKARLETRKQQLQLAREHLRGGIAENKDLLQTDIAAREAAHARMIKAQKTAERSQRLYKNHNISEQQRDLDRYDYQAARATYRKTRRQVALDRQALANARKGLLTQPPMALPYPAVLQSKQAETRQRLAEARARLNKQRTRVRDLRVTSPIDGVVDKTFVDAGEYISAGQPILMMHDPENVWIEAKIKETKIHQLQVGQSVAIHVDARPDTTFSGHVQVIGGAATNQFALLPNPNPSGNFTKITQRIPVRVAIEDGPRAALSPGMMVEVDVDVSADGGDDADQEQAGR